MHPTEEHDYQESPPEINSIYGGVAAYASETTSEVSQQPIPTTPTVPNWSTSVQTLLDQPPAALSNRLLWGGTAFVAVFGVWATCGQIEEVGHARGKLVPQGEVYKINPTDLGKIVNIAVKEGQKVKAGQVIAELDTDLAANEVQGLQQQLLADKIRYSQTLGLIARTRLEVQNRAAMTEAEERAAYGAIATVEAKAEALQQMIAQLQTQQKADMQRRDRLSPLLATSKQMLAQQQQDLAAYQERLERLKPLADEGAISRELVFNAERELNDRHLAITRTELEATPMTRERLFEAEQAIANTTRTITQHQGELQQTREEINRLQAELAQKQAQGKALQLEAQQKIQQLELEVTQLKAKFAETQTLLNGAQAKLKQRYLYSPTNGVVTSLNISRAGEVVQPGQNIAEIAPQNTPLVLQTVLPNQEAGFIKTGMPVQVKFDAYPYQDYGVIPGKVISVSPDAKVDEKLGAVYRLEVALERDYIIDKQQKMKLKAGQTAGADIIIRRRTIIDMLIEPIKQLQKGGIKL
ncbi:MAG: HlyD family efflux transporter periplasmic adaptor subunit [Nostocaceae cyanobacterium]|nr:HlyD family efflux transporter periplasmic adaptor subunit [Nostocaceae cyanobacterium]